MIILRNFGFQNGLMKLLNFDQTIKWVESYNYPSELVYIGIFVELLAPMLILINLYRKLAIYTLIIFCIMTAIMFHSNISNPMELTQFLKNLKQNII